MVYSQASVRKKPEFPTRMFPPMESKIPPTETVGSVPAPNSIWVTMEVVVVFPWVPEMAMDSP